MSQTLSAIVDDLANRGVALFVADLHEPVRVFLRDHGFLDIPDGHDFPTLTAAVEAAATYVQSLESKA